MAGNYTLTIIKPDAFASGKAGKIIAHLEQQGFRVRGARVTHLSEVEAKGWSVSRIDVVSADAPAVVQESRKP